MNDLHSPQNLPDENSSTYQGAYFLYSRPHPLVFPYWLITK